MKAFYWIFAFFTIAIETLLIFSYDLDSYSFCGTSECVEFFLEEFSLAIKFPITVLSIAVAVSALAKLSIAQRTYVDQAKTSRIANSLNHLDHFKNLASFHLEGLDRLKHVPISYPILHAAFFPDISLSGNKPHKAIKEWAEFIRATTESLENEGGRSLVAIHYRKKLEPIMRSIGISISSEIEDSVFFAIEEECYSLLRELDHTSDTGLYNQFQTPEYTKQRAG
ncbi:retron Ec48 family effector membrane protein [Marinobacter sp.]|uniref:retron Ec48 family effector membrane protein n=1 Tax=Marinobacter sp. TaxID=50741 RepID=UPI001B61FD04|nr:retron Ec48 family effector membrane protein [Marinobacter sp.]MBQ0834756.1 retron Ec48 family effector membrane protein [Marinobacter sp.]